MGKPTVEELQPLFAQISVMPCTDNNPLPDSSVTGIIKPTVVTSKQVQLANIHTPAEANTNTPCPREAQLEALHQSQPALEEGIAATRPTTTTPTSCPEPLVDAWSPSSSEDGSDSEFSMIPCSRTQPARAKRCTPQKAKEVSAFSPGVFVEVTTASGPHDHIKEEDNGREGMVLRDFLDGQPLYYRITSRHQELLATQTKTIIGMQYATQPVESCFGKKQQAEAAHEQAANSDSGCYTEEAHEKPLPPNRTFSNHWFAVAKSRLGGFGVFAIVDIPESTHILLEQPLFTIKQYKFLERKYQLLDEERKAVFDGLHGYHKQNPDPLHQKWHANHFYLSTSSEGVFAIASNFNHACKPQRNTQYCWDGRRQVMTFTATKAIAKGDEILVSYGTSRRHIFQNFGFICHCGACDDEEWEIETTNFWQQF